jgi:glycosyltransferase involved in cell wall biosynthesis
MKILMVAPTPMLPPTSGNRARILSLVESLAGLGHEVHFLHVQRETGDSPAMHAALDGRYYPVGYTAPRNRYRQTLRRLARRLGLDYGYRFGIDDWYDPAIDAHVRKLFTTIQPDAVLVEYVYLSRLLQQVPATVLKLVDTHDVFGNRHRRYLNRGRTAIWFSTSPAEEARGLERADVVIAIQRNEADYFRTLMCRPVITVGHVVKLDVAAAPVAHRRVLLVGSDNPINVDSFRHFMQRVVPLIRARVPDTEIAVAGTLCRAVTAAGVTLLGELDDLAPAYRSARVVVNPVLFGTGLKVKCVEALGYGKPLVTTRCGADGLERAIPHALLMADAPADFASAVALLLSDDAVAAGMARAARRFAADWNHECLKELAACLRTSGARPASVAGAPA